MKKKYMQWLDGLDLKRKVVYAILAVLLLVLLPEFIAPSIEWKILITHLHDWFNNNYWFLLRLFLCGAALLLLYGFFVRGKLGLIFGKLIQHRVLLVLFVGVVEGILVYNYWHDAIDYFRIKNNEGAAIGSIPVWMGTFITTLIAAPIALFIWSFRNEDKKLDLQHTEENIRQADFHKIEEWATTFPKVTAQESKSVDSTEPEANTKNTDPGKPESGETNGSALQIAAIYQLLPYLKGQYGDHFIRPTSEIYRSLLSSWQWNNNSEKPRDEKTYKTIQPDHITTLHVIFKQEHEFFRELHENPICRKSNWIPLRAIDLKNIVLVETDIRGIDLREATLFEADLSKVNLSKANLSRANFYKANLNEANLSEANLSMAMLLYTDLSKTDLSEANLSDADLSLANLSAANFSGACLKEASLYMAELRDANFSGANLYKADFRKANLNRTNLSGANLSDAGFLSANLTGANLIGANLSKAFLHRIDITGANLSGANLIGATYDDRLVKETIMDENTILRDGSNWKPPEEDSDQKPD